MRDKCRLEQWPSLLKWTNCKKLAFFHSSVWNVRFTRDLIFSYLCALEHQNFGVCFETYHMTIPTFDCKTEAEKEAQQVLTLP